MKNEYKKSGKKRACKRLFRKGYVKAMLCFMAQEACA